MIRFFSPKKLLSVLSVYNPDAISWFKKLNTKSRQGPRPVGRVKYSSCSIYSFTLMSFLVFNKFPYDKALLRFTMEKLLCLIGNLGEYIYWQCRDLTLIIWHMNVIIMKYIHYVLNNMRDTFRFVNYIS